MKEDAKLDGLLREWQEDVKLPAGFQREVWQRIARRSGEVELRGFPGRLIDFCLQQGSPQPAVTWVVAALILGFSFGYMRTDGSGNQTKSAGESQYVNSINPVFQARFMAKQ